MRSFLLVCLLLVGLLPAEGQTLYVRNRPFQGLITGNTDHPQVDLRRLLEALGGAVIEVDGGWAILTETEYTAYLAFQKRQASAPAAQAPTQPPAELPAEPPLEHTNPPENAILIQGKLIEAQLGPSDEIMVSLEQAVAALGGTIVRNPSLGTIDVYGTVPTLTQTYQATASAGGSGAGQAGGGEDLNFGVWTGLASQARSSKNPAAAMAGTFATPFAVLADGAAYPLLKMGHWLKGKGGKKNSR